MEKDTGVISKKVEDFLQAFRKGEEFTRELLRENKKLRCRVVQLEGKTMHADRHGSHQLSALEERIKILEETNKALFDRYRKAEEENKDFATRDIEVEAENNNLANLYVAS